MEASFASPSRINLSEDGLDHSAIACFAVATWVGGLVLVDGHAKDLPTISEARDTQRGDSDSVCVPPNFSQMRP